jgi:adenosylcobinamide-phosphate synthase
MGNAITSCEPFFRNLFKNEKIAGTLFALILISGCWLLCFLLLMAMQWIHPAVGFVTEVVMVFYCFSSKSLAQAGLDIHKLLASGQVDQARNAVAMIVGRDVQSYQADDIARATVETVAENFVDGFLSPLLFAVIGGGPLALTYKMVNTLDSMVGYKNERYLYFGRAAARIDDVANFIPARLSIYVIGLAAQFSVLKSGCRALAVARKEGRNHSSPNAGHPEAAFAGAMGIRLNGPNYYGGRLVEKPFIGMRFDPPGVEHIKIACRLMLRSSEIGCLLAWGLGVLLQSVL